MSKKEPIFCGLAFGSVSIGVRGDYRPCCSVLDWPRIDTIIDSHPLENINSPDLVNVRKQLINGEWPKHCLNCKWSEEASGKSMRTVWDKPELRNKLPMTEEIDPNNIFYLDIGLGNKCNSKCMTCNWNSSSLWVEEHAFITGNHWFHTRESISYKEIKQLTETFPNLDRIQFIGGEPTIMSEHLEFLKELINNEKSQNIRLNYVTNLTGISDEMISLWKKFKSVEVSISIDGYGKTNDYIRYPIQWSKVEKNIRKYFSLAQEFPNQFYLSLSATASIFNSNCLHELFSFWYNITKEYKISNVINMQRARYPNYVDLSLLDKKFREPEIIRLKEMKALWDQDSESPIFADFNTLIEWLESPHDNDPIKLDEAKTFIKKSDLFRNRNISDFLPNLSEYLFNDS